ncbi:MAG: hypothetical protein R3F53_25775 [Gammaproteobacteria bacterium]
MSWLIRFARALRHPNFAVYAAGNVLNLIGHWMQRIAVGWLTWQLTESATWLGIMTLAELGPTLLIGPLGACWLTVIRGSELPRPLRLRRRCRPGHWHC